MEKHPPWEEAGPSAPAPAAFDVLLDVLCSVAGSPG